MGAVLQVRRMGDRPVGLRETQQGDRPVPPVTLAQCESAEFAAAAQGVHSVSIVLVDNTADRAH